MTTKLLLVGWIVSMAMAVHACDHGAQPMRTDVPDTTGFAARVFTEQDRVMPYRLFIPQAYDNTARYPLVLWLHGAGGIGTDNRLQISGDQIAGTHLWTAAETQRAHPAFVVVPQTAQSWNTTQSADLQDSSRSVAAIVDQVTAEFTIDPRRVYVLGQSVGGAGAWNLITNLPQRFAAGILVCPGLPDITRATAAIHTPLWIFEGDRDSGAARVRELVATLKASGGQPRYTEYPNMGHDIWTRVFAEPDIVEWLFAQSRE